MSAISEARNLLEITGQYKQDNSKSTKNGTHESWTVYERSFSDYLEDFYQVVNGKLLIEHLQSLEKPTVVDLCSGPGAIKDLFYSLDQKNKLGVAVGLTDMRNDREIARDFSNGIQCVSGDLVDTKTWAKLRKTLNGRKADLVVESAVAGLWRFPQNKKFYAIALNRAWSLLSENNGTLLAEVPESGVLGEAGIDMPRWKGLLKDRDFDFAYEFDSGSGFLRLKRSIDSPKNLPLLP